MTNSLTPLTHSVDTTVTIPTTAHQKSDVPKVHATVAFSEQLASPSSDQTRAFFDRLSRYPNDSSISIVIDPLTGAPVVKVIGNDGSTVILQVPSELSLRLSATLPATIGVLADTLT